jgi:hypothetical protein
MPESARLIIIVEGPTEANFVRRVLAVHLGRFGVVAVPSIVGKAKAADRGLQGAVCVADIPMPIGGEIYATP